jgi:rRNA maturation RNase YbeY
VITYHYLTDFKLGSQEKYTDWIERGLRVHKSAPGTIAYIFCSDEKVLEINRRHLNHDFYTDIITFQYAPPPEVSGDIYISIDRVRENAITYREPFERELMRVMIHGVLHLLDFKDTTDEEKAEMRKLENEIIDLFHVKH